LFLQLPQLGVLQEIVVGSKTGYQTALSPVQETTLEQIAFEECGNGAPQQLGQMEVSSVSIQILGCQRGVTVQTLNVAPHGLATVVEEIGFNSACVPVHCQSFVDELSHPASVLLAIEPGFVIRVPTGMINPATQIEGLPGKAVGGGRYRLLPQFKKGVA